uniref:Uncharacterized protein n=1 Tax=Glossina austeni TaxID=7395 RepID=A0A1A9VXR0_GLOAU
MKEANTSPIPWLADDMCNKILCIVIFSLFFKEVSNLRCHVCNSRDHLSCDDIMYSADPRYLTECVQNLSTCAVLKGQWGGIRHILLRRGCGPLHSCHQAHAICCQCDTDGCNFSNDCIDPTPENISSCKYPARFTSIGMDKFMTLFVIWMIIHFNSSHAQDQTENPDEEEDEDHSGFKCYNCSSYSQPDCYGLAWGQAKYLHSCLEKSCSLVEMEHPFMLGVAIRVRRCGVFMTCDHVEYPVCCSCDLDGCNGEKSEKTSWFLFKIQIIVASLSFPLKYFLQITERFLSCDVQNTKNSIEECEQAYDVMHYFDNTQTEDYEDNIFGSEEEDEDMAIGYKLKTVSITAENQFKCYNCNAMHQPDCNDVKRGQRKYLHACYESSCSLLEMEHQYSRMFLANVVGLYVKVRRCGLAMDCYHIDYPICCQCEADGCNGGSHCSRAHDPLMDSLILCHHCT